jgi:hypothetical protein
MKATKEKKGGSDKVSVSELSPWPSYIEVCVLDYCDLLTYCTRVNCNSGYCMEAIILGPGVQLHISFHGLKLFLWFTQLSQIYRVIKKNVNICMEFSLL